MEPLDVVKKKLEKYVTGYEANLQDDLVQEGMIAAWQLQQQGEERNGHLVQRGKRRIRQVLPKGEHLLFGGGHLLDESAELPGDGYDYTR